MQITDVKIYPIREEKLKAFVSIVLDDCFMVNDIKIIQGKDGFFISMPSRRKKNGRFKDVAHPLNNETRQMMEQRILGEFEGKAQDEGSADGAAAELGGKGPEPAGEPPVDREEKSLDEVAEIHLRDSFWGT